MKFANASKLDRKSGVRWGEPGAPVDSLRCCFDIGFHSMSPPEPAGSFPGGFFQPSRSRLPWVIAGPEEEFVVKNFRIRQHLV